MALTLTQIGQCTPSNPSADPNPDHDPNPMGQGTPEEQAKNIKAIQVLDEQTSAAQAAEKKRRQSKKKKQETQEKMFKTARAKLEKAAKDAESTSALSSSLAEKVDALR